MSRLDDDENVTAEFTLTRDGLETKVTIEAPSYLDVAKAMHYLGKKETIMEFINGVNDDEGWDE